MAEIVKIGGAAPDENLVKICESLLDRAKSGELRSLVWAGTLEGGKFMRGMETDDTLEAAGLVYMALHGIAHNRMVEGENDFI